MTTTHIWGLDVGTLLADRAHVTTDLAGADDPMSAALAAHRLGEIDREIDRRNYARREPEILISFVSFSS